MSASKGARDCERTPSAGWVIFQVVIHELIGTAATSEDRRMAKVNVNGKVLDVKADGEIPLLWVLREQLGLTGTKFGCGIAQCGACSVHINGDVRRSCSMPVGALQPTDR